MNVWNPRTIIRGGMLLAFLGGVPLLAQEASAAAPPAPNPPVLLEVHKIWDAGGHNAFTDLIRWHDRWWCTFREAQAHVGGDGQIRVILSSDGQVWESAALVAEQGIDLRDPKFSITPDDRLMIVCGGSVYLGTQQLKGRQPRVLFSRDGRSWTAPQRVLGEGDWLWRVTWLGNMAYGTSYKASASAKTNLSAQSPAQSNPEWPLKLYRSDDGLKWDFVSTLEVAGRPNETTLRFLPNGDLMAMVRREAGNCMGWIGTAAPPYQHWAWNEGNYRFGGPNFIRLPDGSLIAGTRDYSRPKQYSTLIARLTAGNIKPLFTLPSGGDNSYPGMVWHQDTLWVSYYSSHEGKTSIYLARVKLPTESSQSTAQSRIINSWSGQPSDTTYGVRYLPKATITSDGKADEPAWVLAKLENHFQFPWKQTKAPPTEFRALCDDTFPYFTFRVHDEDIVVLDKLRDEEDEVFEDRVELYFSRDEQMEDYFCLEVDSRGRIFDYRGAYYRQLDPAWKFEQVETKASSIPQGYVVEGQIPLAAFEALGFPRLRPGARIRCGLYRAEFSHDRTGQTTQQERIHTRGRKPDGPLPIQDWISWVDPKTKGPDFHVPDSLGWLEIVK